MDMGGTQGWDLDSESDAYPQSIKELTNYPERLYGRGSVEVLSGPCIAIIGARRATPYGLAVAKMAGRVAAESGVCVVSGGAMGCDSAAARSCLDSGGKTIVVSGCGADVVYPQTSSDVYERAVSTGGAVISAERWGSPPRRWAFPKRNALIAALGSSLVVTEGGYRSGTLGTADAALELGRHVYAIPGSIFSPLSKGTNSLACEGARLISDEESLAMSIAMDFGTLLAQGSTVTKPAGPILSALIANPMRPDDLASALGEEVLTVLRTLTDYEARNLVVRLPDGRYSPSEAYLMGELR